MPERFKPALAYNILTPIYDRVNEALGFGKVFSRKVLRYADINEDDKVLDVGMGTGTFITLALERFPNLEIVGIDPDKKTITIANDKLRNLGKKPSLVRGFAQNMPFEDGSFDKVVSSLVFHHIPQEIKPQALKEIYRVLKDDGRFLLADFGKPETLTETVLLNVGSIFDGRQNMQANLKGQLPTMLRNAGFVVNETHPKYKGVQFLSASKQTP